MSHTFKSTILKEEALKGNLRQTEFYNKVDYEVAEKTFNKFLNLNQS